jgi:sugar O-acyltransferase (sialic acid O-acetyltransferase NeuD family)
MSESLGQAVALLGAGGHAQVVLESARLAGMNVCGYHDDNTQALLEGLEYLGPLAEIAPGAPAILCVGDVRIRRRLLGDVGWQPVSVIHPSAIVSPDAVLEVGVFVGPRVIINPRAHIEAHAILNSGCIVEHDAHVGRNTHVAPGSVLAGGAKIGSNTLLGIGAKVLPGVCVGDECTVGAGAVVTRHIDGGSSVGGIPAGELSS